jgi:hypothetical protein
MKIKIACFKFMEEKGKDPMSKEEFLAGVAKNLTNEYTDSEEIIKKTSRFCKSL